MKVYPGDGLIEKLLSSEPAANAGLIWDRYLEVRGPKKRRDDKADELGPILASFKKEFNRKTGASLLAAYHERFGRALQAWSGSRVTTAVISHRTAWRLATGLGIAHSTENGFSFEPNIGVPYLPGSSVKGLCRRTAAVLEWEPDQISDLFGPEKVSSTRRAFQGKLIFFDALPTKWPELEVDIVNCHHPAYYSSLSNKKDRKRPSETESPVPVLFLTVAPDTTFTFRMAAPDRASLDQGLSLLKDGLDLLGIGAKTAVGYGVMVPPKQGTSS
ncbi:MAG: type III-B CRISPR module RAMP protein Cmr6 [Bryobacteraceae bacterium]|nr:type III-B CRISPR module RAMP protein Cmr6 [Bryobacteraceae bacterium]